MSKPVKGTLMCSSNRYKYNNNRLCGLRLESTTNGQKPIQQRDTNLKFPKKVKHKYGGNIVTATTAMITNNNINNNNVSNHQACQEPQWGRGKHSLGAPMGRNFKNFSY